jgi:hypothetical protein
MRAPHDAPHATPQQALASLVRRDYERLVELCRTTSARRWERTTCRACAAPELIEVLSLGEQPPANAYLHPEEVGLPELRFPLSLRLCERCGRVQLGHVVPAELLFRSYLFFTSSSQRMSEHFSRLLSGKANELVAPGGLVVEIGSNDGSGSLPGAGQHRAAGAAGAAWRAAWLSGADGRHGDVFGGSEVGELERRQDALADVALQPYMLGARRV